MVITHLRRYEADRTTGQIFVEGRVLGNTLEDIGRPAGIKIPKETCIPEGRYRVAITQSTRFGRPMILLYTDGKDFACMHEGIRFTGIRVHSGTKTSHTEGCVLYQGDLPALESMIAQALNQKDVVTWEIGRLP
jgi:hypothetical protein